MLPNTRTAPAFEYKVHLSEHKFCRMYIGGIVADNWPSRVEFSPVHLQRTASIKATYYWLPSLGK